MSILPGLKAALNVHPMVVHFPIVLWLTALLFELLAVLRGSDEMQRTASRMLYLGTIAAGVAIATGLAAEDSLPLGDAQRVVGIHETLMLITTAVALILCFLAFVRRKTFTAQMRKWMVLGLLVLTILLVLGTDRGAELVYGYGANVNWSMAQPQKK